VPQALLPRFPSAVDRPDQPHPLMSVSTHSATGPHPVAEPLEAGPIRSTTRRHRVLWVLSVFAFTLALGGVVGFYLSVHQQLLAVRHSLAVSTEHLSHVRAKLSTADSALVANTTSEDEHKRDIAKTTAAIATAQQDVATASVASELQSSTIALLHACVNGVAGALSAKSTSNFPEVVPSINSAASSCLLLGGSGHGEVYPFDFPDPYVLNVDGTYYAFSTNSVQGNIQVLQSTNLTQWTTIGDALPSLPSWAYPGSTWAPSVLQVGSVFLMYYSTIDLAADQECISVAFAFQPQGPYIDPSKTPFVCQSSLGGSIDPSPFVDQSGNIFLVWKSQGTADIRPAIWSQPLLPGGTALSNNAPTQVLATDEPWQRGNIEGPDMIYSGGEYLLFYSASAYTSSSYAIGYATCSGPLGPCTNRSTTPLLASQPGMSGPGGPSVFSDAQGNLWMAFHAWLPGLVGYPHSRALFLRPLAVQNGIPTIGS
jgi:hypothetical protein